MNEVCITLAKMQIESLSATGIDKQQHRFIIDRVEQPSWYGEELKLVSSVDYLPDLEVVEVRQGGRVGTQISKSLHSAAECFLEDIRFQWDSDRTSSRCHNLNHPQSFNRNQDGDLGILTLRHQQESGER